MSLYYLILSCSIGAPFHQTTQLQQHGSNGYMSPPYEPLYHPCALHEAAQCALEFYST